MKKLFIYIVAASALITSCYSDEDLDVPVQPEVELMSELDIYIYENFTEPYNVAIRYRFEDNLVQAGQRATPPRLEVVRPMLDFIQKFWFEPYFEVENGEEFFRRYVPIELVFLGGPIFNADGTVVLGVADNGARVTFTDVNSIDTDDEDWVEQQLQTVYHEFAHVVHQNFKLPNAFETISPSGYTGPGSWFTLTEEEALERGYVSPYATSSVNEDYAEIVAFFLFDKDFHENFTVDEADCTTAECEARNEGRERIRQKLASISGHYEKVTQVSLEELREAVQAIL